MAMVAFFDPSLIDLGGNGFFREDKLVESLKMLIPNAHLSTGKYTLHSTAGIPDLAWNNMDQEHRPHIHRTYAHAMRIFVSPRGTFSLTRFGRWPSCIPVFDGQHKPNGFYQVIMLFSLFVVVIVSDYVEEGGGTRLNFQWTIASHRSLKFLHPFLHRRLVKLNEVQNAEDDVVRMRRVELRKAGYRFGTDVPDFYNSNVVAHNTIFPPISAPASILLSDLPNGKPYRVELADRGYIMQRENDGVKIWPGICLHEGAQLDTSNLRNDRVVCPWHGLSYGPQRLNTTNPEITMCGAQMRLMIDRIVLQPVASTKSQ